VGKTLLLFVWGRDDTERSRGIKETFFAPKRTLGQRKGKLITITKKGKPQTNHYEIKGGGRQWSASTSG